MAHRATPGTTSLVAILATLLAVLALVATGCGSDDENESASATWADDFCGALTTWKGSIESVGDTLKNVDELSKAKIEQAANDVSDANQTLADDVDALGEPPQEA